MIRKRGRHWPVVLGGGVLVVVLLAQIVLIAFLLVRTNALERSVYGRSLESQVASAEKQEPEADRDADRMDPGTIARALNERREELELARRLDELLDDPAIEATIAEAGVHVNRRGPERADLVREGVVEMGITIGSGGDAELTPRLGGRVAGDLDSGLVNAVIRTHLESQEEGSRGNRWVDRVAELANEPEISSILRERDIVAEVVDGAFERTARFRSPGSDRMVRVTADPTREGMRVEGARYDTYEGAVEAVAQQLGALPEEVDDTPGHELAERYLQKLAEEDDFVRGLRDYGLRTATEPEYRNGSVMLPMVDEEGELAGAVSVESRTGGVWLLDAGLERIRALGSLAALTGAERPEADDDQRTFLLFGMDATDEVGLADTIILARVDRGDREARMLSIPRDLWYEGIRVNALPQLLGLDGAVREFEALLGVSIDHYALVGMDAFRSVVDAVGGVEVEIEEEFVDHKIIPPLDLAPGTHRLDGEHALSLARSRRTTDDFSRADRQQAILEGFQERVAALSPTNVTAAYEIARGLIEHVRTDVRPMEAARYLYRYSDVTGTSRTVLSTENVLYQTYSRQLPSDLRWGLYREEPEDAQTGAPEAPAGEADDSGLGEDAGNRVPEAPDEDASLGEVGQDRAVESVEEVTERALDLAVDLELDAVRPATKQDLAAEPEDQDEPELGQWILLPRHDDYGRLRRFVREFMAGS